MIESVKWYNVPPENLGENICQHIQLVTQRSFLQASTVVDIKHIHQPSGSEEKVSLCRPDLPSWTELNSARIHACLISSPCFLSKSCSTLGHSVCTTDLQKTLQTVARCSNLHHNQAFMQQKRTLLIRKLKDNLSYFAHNGTIFSLSLFFF